MQADAAFASVTKPWNNSVAASEVSARDVLVLDTCSTERWSELIFECQQMNMRILLLVSLTQQQDRLANLDALRQGIHGIVAMSPDLGTQLPKAIRAVLEDRLWISRRSLEDYVKQTNPLVHQMSLANDFTPREEQIIQLMRQGLSNRKIGNVFGISERTIKFHVSNILRKSQIGSRKALLSKREPTLASQPEPRALGERR
jgi:DNA-binding NarL/FixJ family response regulator